MKMIIEVLSILSLCVFAVGSIAYRMIGVETLYTVQVSWYLLASDPYYKSFFIRFNNLNYCIGQFSFTIQGEKLKNNFGRLGLTDDLNDNFMVYAIFNGVFIALYATAFIFRSILKRNISIVKKK